MKKTINKIISKFPLVKRLEKQIADFGAFAAGHYYSTIPSSEDKDFGKKRLANCTLPDIDLNLAEQITLLEQYKKYYSEIPFPEEQQSGSRYYFNQGWFCYSDAIMLYSFIRHFKPQRIIEIGSGYSSSVMLDTLQKFNLSQTQMTFIEPFPDRLLNLLSDQDKKQTEILVKRVQDVDLSIFSKLQPGDLLFVDSSHVMKFGSDFQRILFDIVPSLPKGIFLHFHDIFYPFEYPLEWIEKGRYWNECYMIRAFLAYNSTWKIRMFNDYINKHHAGWIKDNMPLCTKNYGGSIYLEKIN